MHWNRLYQVMPMQIVRQLLSAGPGFNNEARDEELRQARNELRMAYPFQRVPARSAGVGSPVDVPVARGYPLARGQTQVPPPPSPSSPFPLLSPLKRQSIFALYPM